MSNFYQVPGGLEEEGCYSTGEYHSLVVTPPRSLFSQIPENADSGLVHRRGNPDPGEDQQRRSNLQQPNHHRISIVLEPDEKRQRRRRQRWKRCQQREFVEAVIRLRPAGGGDSRGGNPESADDSDVSNVDSDDDNNFDDNDATSFRVDIDDETDNDDDEDDENDNTSFANENRSKGELFCNVAGGRAKKPRGKFCPATKPEFWFYGVVIIALQLLTVGLCAFFSLTCKHQEEQQPH